MEQVIHLWKCVIQFFPEEQCPQMLLFHSTRDLMYFPVVFHLGINYVGSSPQWM